MTSFTPFRSPRLTYRAAEDNDADDAFVHSLQSHPASYATSSINLLKPQAKRDTLNEYKKYLTSDKALIAVIIELPPGAHPSQINPTPTPIGVIALRAPAPDLAHHRETNLSVDIAHDYQNRGYGSEAINWILDWAFRIAGVHRVTAEAVGYNVGAVRLYQRLGFTVEGRRREAFWFDGAWHDDVLFGMLEGEWRGLRGL
ncbi:GNAT family acetyltransferase [Aspergillus ellipticus CBS 707.79]|uniref:GNAT family acetyltransferase n=1 Tax=Aspergillus ellipticus CBS 707.79 TaxID=1448320 RepID=A0A319CUT0_9EURO|nr:GNAT family acetyltransferase [Aspergillus ellipticus CBS 707.79]